MSQSSASSKTSSAQGSCCSSLVLKYLMALTGLALMGFVVVHLLGNLILYLPVSQSINVYSHKLTSMGPLLIAAEMGLLAMALIHIFTALTLKKSHREARPERYRVWKSKATATKVTNRGGGEDSSVKSPEAQPSNIASQNMIFSGVVLLVFLIVHIWHIKFGPGIAQGYVTTVDGVEMRDLHRWIVEAFQNPLAVVFYSGCMVLLGMHLKHGFWSAIQSLGFMCPKHTKMIHSAGVIIAAVLCLGFLLIPPFLFFKGMGTVPGAYQ